MERPRFIVVCADDFGLHPVVDDAILELARLKRLSATSCLVDGPSFSSNASSLLASGLQCGLHLNFTEDFGTGSLRPLGALIRACWLRRLDDTAVYDEIVRQLDRFESVLGRAPDYVDGHQHVHQFPQIREALIRHLNQRYAGHARKPWLRCTASVPQPGASAALRFKSAIIALLGAGRLCRLARQHGYVQNRGLLGVYGFEGGAKAYAGLLHDWLGSVREDDLIMCHPATDIVPDDPLAAQRVAEFQVWKSDDVGRWLGARGLALAGEPGVRPGV